MHLKGYHSVVESLPAMAGKPISIPNSRRKLLETLVLEVKVSATTIIKASQIKEENFTIHSSMIEHLPTVCKILSKALNV